MEYTHRMWSPNLLYTQKYTLHYLLVQKYFILSYRRTIREVWSKCFNCFRTHPKISQSPMGNLPKSRIPQNKDFQR